MPRGTSGANRLIGPPTADPRKLAPLDYLMGDVGLAEEELWKPRKGTYLPSQVRDEDGVVTRRTAYLCCAACGKWSSLWEFDISPFGQVDPPLKCPHCRCVMRPRLAGWGDIDWTAGGPEKKTELLTDDRGTHGP